MKTLLLLSLLLLGPLLQSKAEEMEWPRHVDPIFAQALKSIPYARAFRELYPDATMDFFTVAPEGLCLSMTVGLYQRYRVSLSIPIKLTANRNAIATWKEPSFEVEDVGKIIVAEDDQGYTLEGGWTRKLTYAQFKTLKEHGGDFSAIGLKVNRHQPRKNFDRAWRPGHPDYVLRVSTFSPRKRFGVELPIAYSGGTDDKYDDLLDRIVEVSSGRVVAEIDADPGYNRRINYHAVAQPRWSPDESLLLWQVDGKWSADAVVLVKIHDGRQVWQLDLLTTAQQALLQRTKEAAPKKYLAIKKDHTGWGSAYPDGFTVNVTPDGEGEKTVALPLNVRVDLTSDPKGLDENSPRTLESHLDGVVTKDGKFIVESFHLGPRKP